MAKKSTGKTLVVVESPGKIKTISKYLGPNYIVRASFGHVIDLVTGDKTLRLGVNLEKDYEPKYKILPDKRDKIQAIIDSAAECDQIFLATDPDREGEAIAWHLRSCLESAGKPIYRISFNKITKDGVEKAIANPGQIDENLFYAQQARRVLDRIVGFLASDYLRSAMGPNLSAGRVQSVAARIIVDRELEIENFKPEEFWNIAASLAKSSNEDKFVAKYVKKVLDGETAKKIKADLDTDTYIIDKIEKETKKRNPYPPLTTSTLQQAVSTRYGFPISKTMKVAQLLYEAGLITYMRTDSTRLAPEAITSVRDFLQQNNLSCPATPNYYKSKNTAQDAHEAIRPSDVFKKPDHVFMAEDQQKVYRVIWERFVSCQMNPAEYDTVTATVKSSSGHILKANGRTLKYEGWLAIASDQKKEQGEEDATLPPLSEKDKVILVPPKVTAEQKFTQPPSRYGEASLVKELEKRGIGRPSTFATIAETIKGRNYVELKGKSYHATDVGKQVIGKLSESFKFMDYGYTSDMEGQLDKIADGKLGYVPMMDAFFIPFQKECKVAENTTGEDYGILCKCGAKTILKHGKFGFYLKCVNYPECKETVSIDMKDGKPEIKEKFRNPLVDTVDCPICKKSGMLLNNAGKFGPFYYCQDYPQCRGIRKVPYGKKCVKCGCEMFLTVFNGERKLACMGYFESHKCKNVEDLPAGDNTGGWANPNPLIEKYKKKYKEKKSSVRKVINYKKKKADK